MVRMLCILCFTLGYSITAHAAELVLDLESHQTSLGIPVKAELYGIELPGSLAEADLDHLQKNFAVVIKDDINIISDPRWPQANVQNLTLLLYPRMTGALKVNPIVHAGRYSREQQVHVTEGRTRSGSITLTSSVSTLTPWDRQQIVITAEVITDEKYASLHADELNIPGFEIVPIPASRENMPSGKYRLQSGWILIPFTTGPKQIRPAAIKYRHSGVYTRIYYLPVVEIDIKPLPSYIPPTIPVGKFRLDSTLAPSTLLRTGHLAYWHISLQGESLWPKWPPPILRQISQSDDFQVLPVESVRSSRPDKRGINGSIVHHVPVKPLKNGTIRIPELQLQYFDPDSGRIETIRHQVRQPFSLSMTWRVLLIFVLGAITYFIVQRGYRSLRRRYVKHRMRQAIIHNMNTARDPESIRRYLREYAKMQGWPANISLQQWLAYWNTHYVSSDSLRDVIGKLSLASYAANEEISVTQVGSVISNALATATCCQK
ncbi:MAG: hypothetical protein BMS9Abin26_2005 [Gammaproteobacteria bacterium]|nr:MAG: hypothetical protein BMS9Abin26_2005 [Gammaproteobacteria bacterium]